MVCPWIWVRLRSPWFADHKRFSDVRLELNPILSGYRLHVIYDLHSPLTKLGVNLSASARSEEATAYQSMLEQWSRLREDVGNSKPLVVYILGDKERDYKYGRLNYDRLNENHRHQAKYLKQQCLESKVCFWLARMSSSIDSSGSLASESIFELDNISELDGTEVLERNVSIDEEDIVEISSLKCREANDSDYAEQNWENKDTIYHIKDWVCYISASNTILSGQRNSTPRIFHVARVFAYKRFAVQRIQTFLSMYDLWLVFFPALTDMR